MAMSVVYTTFNGQIVHENRGGVASFYAPDTMGSTVALLNSAGAVTDTYNYWPYGEIQSHVGSSVTPLTFLGMIGYYLDAAGSFLYVRARYLRQVLARWQTVDPVLSWLRYIYADSNPASVADATGLMTFKECERNCQEYLMSPLEACMYCSKAILHFNQNAAKERCKDRHFLPPRMGPGRPGPVPRPPKGQWHDLPPFLGGILGACGYAMSSGTEPLGVIGGGAGLLCGTVLPKLRHLEEDYCSGDDVAGSRGRWPGTSDLYWANYCEYLREAIIHWSGYCESINN